MAEIFEAVKKYIQMRQKTDHQMSNYWMIVYFVPFFVSIVAAGYFLFSLMNQFSSIDFVNSYDFYYDEILSGVVLPWFIVGVSSFLSVVVALIVPYFLINRRKTHFNRQKLLSESLISVIASVAQAKDVNIQDSLLSLKKNVEEANSDKTDKNPILWAILSAFIPFLIFYVFYFLMSDYYKHEQLENSFWEQTNDVLNQLKINVSLPQRAKPIPNRSFILYLILDIVAMIVFRAYWLYALLKDPNQHFEHHELVENQLLIALESADLYKINMGS